MAARVFGDMAKKAHNDHIMLLGDEIDGAGVTIWSTVRYNVTNVISSSFRRIWISVRSCRSYEAQQTIVWLKW